MFLILIIKISYLSGLDFCPQAPLDPAQLTGVVEGQWKPGGDAREEGEAAPSGENRHLHLQKGEAHPNAATWTLAKGLEGVPEKNGELKINCG